MAEAKTGKKRYTRRKDGLYEVTVRVNGKKKHFYGKTQYEAAEKRDDYLAKLADFPYMDEHITLGEWCDAWLKTSRGSLSLGSYRSYKEMFDTYLKGSDIENVLLEDAKPMVFRAFSEKLLEKGLAPRTVNLALQALDQALGRAAADGVIRSNPLTSVKRAKVDRHMQPKALTDEQVQAFFAAVEDPRDARMFKTALYTGLRRGELLGLTWKDIDFKEKTLTVSQTVILGADHKAQLSKTAKTASAFRTISLSDKAIGVLREQHAYTLRLRMKFAQDKDRYRCPLVFPNRFCGVMHPGYLTEKARKYFRKAGLTGFSFHSFRHTHATYLYQHGVDIKVIQQRLGHSTAAVTMDYYSHVSKGQDQAAANVAADII